MNYAESLRIHDDAEQAHTLSQPQPQILYHDDAGTVLRGPYRGLYYRDAISRIEATHGMVYTVPGISRPLWRLGRATLCVFIGRHW